MHHVKACAAQHFYFPCSINWSATIPGSLAERDAYPRYHQSLNSKGDCEKKKRFYFDTSN